MIARAVREVTCAWALAVMTPGSLTIMTARMMAASASWALTIIIAARAMAPVTAWAVSADWNDRRFVVSWTFAAISAWTLTSVAAWPLSAIAIAEITVCARLGMPAISARAAVAPLVCHSDRHSKGSQKRCNGGEPCNWFQELHMKAPFRVYGGAKIEKGCAACNAPFWRSCRKC